MTKYNFDRKASAIIVDVILVNGYIKKKVKMVLDTGSSYVLVSWEVAEALGLQPIFSKKRTDILTASGTEKAPLLTVDEVRFGEDAAENVEVLVHDLPEKSYVDGLLGLSFLRNFNVHLDFKEGILSIE